MKKLFIILIIICIALSAFSKTSAQAEDISGGIGILRHKASLIKVATPEKDILFAPEEFDKAFGLGKVEFIIVTKLPSADEGILKLAGNDVSVSQGISRANIPLLEFLPVSTDIKSSSFFFKCYGKEMECKIDLESGIKLSPPAMSNSSERTYCGIEVTSKVKSTGANRFIVTSAPENGFLTLSSNGIFTFYPKDGYIGVDSFSLYAENNAGASDEVTVSITIESPGKATSSTSTSPEIQKGEICLYLSGDSRDFSASIKDITRSGFAEMASRLFHFPSEGFSECFADSNPSTIMKSAYKSGCFPAELTDKGRESGSSIALTKKYAMNVCENILCDKYPEACIMNRLYFASVEDHDITASEAAYYLCATSELTEGYGNISYFFR